MSQWLPCKRRIFIQRLQKLGFDGPFAGTHHLFITYNKHRLAIPSNAEYSMPQLRMMIREIEKVEQTVILYLMFFYNFNLKNLLSHVPPFSRFHVFNNKRQSNEVTRFISCDA